MKEECCKALLFVFQDGGSLEYTFRMVFDPLKSLALLPFLTLNRLAGMAHSIGVGGPRKRMPVRVHPKDNALHSGPVKASI